MRKIGSRWLPVYWLGNWKTESGEEQEIVILILSQLEVH